MRFLITNLIIITMLSACSHMDVEQNYPKSPEQRQEEKIGKLTGDDGIVLFGGKGKNKATEGINVNSYLWRASLDIVYKLPVTSADPFGGTILTDWYKTSTTSKDRYRLNIFIIGGELRSDAVKVTAFKQILKGNIWVDAPSTPELGIELEDKILERARELRASR